MTRVDYRIIAGIIGGTLAKAYETGGESFRTVIYGSLYLPFVQEAKAQNPKFDTLRFSQAVSMAETDALDGFLAPEREAGSA